MELTVSGAHLSPSRSIRGLIDSGSDATQIPSYILREIGARRIDRRFVRDLSGIRFAVPIYIVHLIIGSVELTAVDVVGRDSTDEVIIGRDLLNQFIITLNGLAHITEISD